MLAIVLAAALSSASPAEQTKAMHDRALAAVRQCLASAASPETCLASARQQCVTLIARGGPGDALLQSYCATVENEGWEEVRVQAEAKMEASLAINPPTLTTAKAARRAWETFRDNWCETEAWSAPKAVTGDYELARESCRKALTQDRLARVRQMNIWLNP